LHKFVLVDRSKYFETAFSGSGASKDKLSLDHIPGGAEVFKRIMRYCYSNHWSALAVEEAEPAFPNIYAAATALQVHRLDTDLDAYLASVIHRDPARTALLLARASGINYESLRVNMGVADRELQVALIGTSINALAAAFAPIQQLCALTPDYFSCVVRAARSQGAPVSLLQHAIIVYCKYQVDDGRVKSARIPGFEPGQGMDGPQFLECVAGAGKISDETDEVFVVHVFDLLTSGVLKPFHKEVGATAEALKAAKFQHNEDEDRAEVTCRGFQQLGLWDNLPHECIEQCHKKFKDRIPAEFISIALIAENERLVTANEGLVALNVELRDALSALHTELGAASTVGPGTVAGGAARNAGGYM
jgi:hypothetical protein